MFPATFYGMQRVAGKAARGLPRIKTTPTTKRPPTPQKPPLPGPKPPRVPGQVGQAKVPGKQSGRPGRESEFGFGDEPSLTQEEIEEEFREKQALDKLLEQPHFGNRLIENIVKGSESGIIESSFQTTLKQAKEKKLTIGLISYNAEKTIQDLLKLANIDPKEIDSEMLQWKTIQYLDEPLLEFIIFFNGSVGLLIPTLQSINPFMIRTPTQTGFFASLFAREPSIEQIPEDNMTRIMGDEEGQKTLENGINSLKQKIKQEAEVATAAEKSEKLPAYTELLKKAIDIGIDPARQKQYETLLNQIKESSLSTKSAIARRSEIFAELEQDVLYAEELKAKELAQKPPVISEQEKEFAQKAVERKLRLAEDKKSLLERIKESDFLTEEEKTQYTQQLNQKLLTSDKIEAIKKNLESAKKIAPKKPSVEIPTKEIPPAEKAEFPLEAEQARIAAEARAKEEKEVGEKVDRILEEIQKDELDQQAINDMEKELESVNDELKQKQEQKEATEAAKEEIKTLEQQQTELEQKLEQIRTARQTTQSQLQNELTAQQALIEARAERDTLALNNRIADIQQQKKEAQEKISLDTGAKIKELDEQLAALELEHTTSIEKRKEQEERLKEAQKDLQQKIKEENDAIRQINEAKLKELQEKEAEAKKLELQTKAQVANNQAALELITKEAAKKQADAAKATQAINEQQQKLDDLEKLRNQLEAERAKLKEQLSDEQKIEFEAKEAEQKKAEEIEQIKQREALAEKKAAELTAQEAAAKALAEKEAADIAAKKAQEELDLLIPAVKQAATDVAQQQQNVRDLVLEQEQAARKRMNDLAEVKKEAVKDIERQIEREKDIAERREIKDKAEQKEEKKDEGIVEGGDAQIPQVPSQIPQAPPIKIPEKIIRPEEPTKKPKRERSKKQPKSKKPVVVLPEEPTKPIIKPPLQPVEQEPVMPPVTPPSKIIPTQAEEQRVTAPMPSPRPPISPGYQQPTYRPTPSLRPSPVEPTSYAPAPTPTTPPTNGAGTTGRPDFTRITRPTIPKVEKKEIPESELVKEKRPEDLTLWERMQQAAKTGLIGRVGVRQFLAYIFMGRAPEVAPPTETPPTTQVPEKIPQPQESPTATFIKSIPEKIGTVFTNTIDYMSKLFGY